MSAEFIIQLMGYAVLRRPRRVTWDVSFNVVAKYIETLMLTGVQFSS